MCLDVAILKNVKLEKDLVVWKVVNARLEDEFEEESKENRLFICGQNESDFEFKIGKNHPDNPKEKIETYDSDDEYDAGIHCYTEEYIADDESDDYEAFKIRVIIPKGTRVTVGYQDGGVIVSPCIIISQREYKRVLALARKNMY